MHRHKKEKPLLKNENSVPVIANYLSESSDVPVYSLVYMHISEGFLWKLSCLFCGIPQKFVSSF